MQAEDCGAAGASSGIVRAAVTPCSEMLRDAPMIVTRKLQPGIGNSGKGSAKAGMPRPNLSVSLNQTFAATRKNGNIGLI